MHESHAREVVITATSVDSHCIRWPGTHRQEDGRPIALGEYVYRIVYEQVKGPLLFGQVVHHACHNPWCINPAHLHAMTQGEHLHEHGTPGDWHQRLKTRCPSGHEYSPENTYLYKTERRCKACHRAAKLRYLKAYRERNKP